MRCKSSDIFENSNIFAEKIRKIMQKIIGIGNSLVDVLARVNHEELLEEMKLPKGSMQLIDSEELALISKRMRTFEHTRASGGSAANTMKALAKMGVDAGFIGKTAADEFGLFFRSELENSGVHTSLICKKTGSTGIASTFITPDGQRTFATYLGVSAGLNADDITADLFEGYDILYIEGYLVQNHELIEHTMNLAKHKRMTICLDLASYNIVENDHDFFQSLLARYVDIVFANEEEARAFIGHDMDEAARELGKLCPVAVVKLGSHGSSVFAHNEYHACPAEKVKNIVDTTGAGDYFAAGFLDAYVHEEPLESCIRQGGILAASVIQVIGTTLNDAEWKQTLSQLRAAN